MAIKKTTTVSTLFNLHSPKELELYNSLTFLSENSFSTKSQIMKKALDKFLKEELPKYEKN